MGSHSDGDSGAGRPAQDDKGAAQPKRPYRTPRLAKYGSLRELALAKGGTKGDGGTPALNSKA